MTDDEVAALCKERSGLKLHHKGGKIKLVAKQGVPFSLRMILDDPRVASLQGLLTAEWIAEDQC
jgi:hypothetical protein